MDKLKSLANKAKNRLLSRGLMETYSMARRSSQTSFQDNLTPKEKECLYLDNQKMMKMSSYERERYLLESICKYHQERQKRDLKIG